MSISSINTNSFSSEAVTSKPDPAQVKKAAQQNQDVKNKQDSTQQTPVPQVQTTQAAPPVPSVNTSGQTVGQVVNVKA
ncbi:hypothetical protein H8K32_15520 [Undibacterium jejuense]|uniref:Uncharacterized protein n=1 Tax=Undibacterium jejuense TaxID=1344949 RepID=A0A923HGW6_9BURK|nr:hypothetical protein [Undibacterium jejuense]MBC3863514.1 hypothetical protein [Undibacterium jejuense]